MTRSAKLTFLENHLPSLSAGAYEISVTQTVRVDQEPHPASFATNRKIGIAAERTSLNPKAVHQVFPPDHSRGDHDTVLPHVILERSTLPWERSAEIGTDVPWLGLLVFHGAEAPETKPTTAGQLFLGSSTAPFFPSIEMEDFWQAESDPATVIDVPALLLRRIVPTVADLRLLSHVRKTHTEQALSQNTERAAVVANRLPMIDGLTTVHLVSLENRYEGGVFNFQGARDDETIRLISLKSWSFSCRKNGRSLTNILLGLSLSSGHTGQAGLCLPADEADTAAVSTKKANGYVLLPHRCAEGRERAAWYHGPLLPGQNTASDQHGAAAVHAAEDLYTSDAEFELLDVSYGAAWQLGRLTALRDKPFAQKLLAWKRKHAQRLHREGEAQMFANLFPESDQPNEFPELESWLKDLALLKSVPFGYLVPSAKMLPREALRLFWLDWQWVEALLDGAFSLGRVLPGQHANEPRDPIPSIRHRPITGFLLRSEAVAKWPELRFEMNGLSEGDATRLLRLDKLSNDTLLCLYDGPIQSLDIFQKPETLHFGLTLGSGEKSGFYKQLRHPETGAALSDDPADQAEATWRDGAPNRVMDTSKFAAVMADKLQKAGLHEGQGTWTSADTAMQMIQAEFRTRIIVA
ncbi:hypothetical protein [Shimia ponticola]|uniref:hypothetical protein n=1 Tax=Shimia ponticola TaxID=2582893 RepID=UPI0011BDD713|nr:hypothetical protein [Shimia ponticola]